MKIEHHVTLSIIISGILYAFFRSWGLSIASLITGVFIDIDHIIDYVMERGINFRRKDILTFFYKENHRRITLIFHGWEWLFFLVATAISTNFNPWTTGILIGYGHHIVSDYYYSKASVSAYSLIWRWKNNFNSEIIFPRNRGYNPRV